jgi:hypothetical protein
MHIFSSGLGQLLAGRLLAEVFSRGCECRHWSLSVSSSPSPSPSLKSSLKLNQTFALTLIWAREQLSLRATVRFPFSSFSNYYYEKKQRQKDILLFIRTYFYNTKLRRTFYKIIIKVVFLPFHIANR